MAPSCGTLGDVVQPAFATKPASAAARTRCMPTITIAGASLDPEIEHVGHLAQRLRELLVVCV